MSAILKDPLSDLVDDISWRFRVRLPKYDGWLPYDHLTFGPSLEDCDRAGDHTLDNAIKNPVEFAQSELDDALVEIASTCRERIGQDLEGLRIEVWPNLDHSGDPAVVIVAPDHDVATSRLTLVAGDVRTALAEVARSRRRLRDAIIEASEADRLSRNHIAATVAGALSRRLVLETLVAHDLLLRIQRGLPDTWTAWAPESWTYCDDPDNGQAGHLGPFRMGNLGLQVSDTAQVQVRLHDRDIEEFESYDFHDPDELEALSPDDRSALERQWEQERREVRDRRRSSAQIVCEVMSKLGLHLTTEAGQMAGVDELVDLTPGWLNATT